MTPCSSIILEKCARAIFRCGISETSFTHRLPVGSPRTLLGAFCVYLGPREKNLLSMRRARRLGRMSFGRTTSEFQTARRVRSPTENRPAARPRPGRNRANVQVLAIALQEDGAAQADLDERLTGSGPDLRARFGRVRTPQADETTTFATGETRA